MDRRRAAGALFALAACVAATAAAPTASNQTALDLYDGTTEGCYYNFQHYGEGDRIMTNEPCLNCTCHNRMLMCYLRVCPFTKPIGQDCTVEKRADQCCPIVTCPDVPVDLLTSTSTTSPAEYGATGVGKLDKYGCSLNGKYFPEGSKVPPMPNKPCEHCYCIRNMTTCVMQECTLHVDGCTPIYHKDVCCPVRYSCDHPEDEIPLLDDMTTTVRPTPGFLLTTTTLSPVTQMSQDCVHDDQIVPDGALIKTEKACEHCYCMKGDIVCVVQECGTPMENEGKNCTSQPPREGQCCPDTYICEGDEVTTELLSESTTQTLVTEELTTILPPRRVGVEGSGYRNEPDEPFTELPTLETETEGSGYEEVTEVAIDIIGTTTKKQEEGESSTEDSFAFGTSTARTPTLEEIETTEPDKGLNTVPSGVIDEEHSITEKATFPAETVTEQILVEDNKTDQGLNEDLIPETTPTPERTAGLEDVYITTEPIFKKEDETVTESGLVESEKPTTVSSHIAEQLTTLSEQATSETKSPLDDEYEIKTTVITSSEVTEKAPEEAIDKKTTTESIKEAFTTPVSSKPLEEVTINEVEPSKTDAPAVITERIDTIETTSVDNKENEVEEDIPRIPGEGDCLLNEVTYRNNSNVPSTNNCHSSCKCVSSIIKCDPIICSPPPEYMDNCQPTYDSPESCCPTYVCHADETMPPQPHSQMSGTESPAIVPSIECNGDQCEVSKDKTDIDSPEKPIISECGLADCSDLAQKPVHPPKPYSEDCVGIDCQATPQNTCEGDSCGVIEPEIKPVHVVPLCDNENDCKVAHPPQPPCEGDACTPKGDCNTDDCRTGITTIPDSESQKPLTCNGNSDCQTPQSDSVTCEGDLCRKIEKTETESKLPSEDCKDSDCKEGKPDLEIGTEKPSKTKQPDEEDKQLSSTEEVHEVETVTKSEEPVDATESAVEKQTEIPELQTTSRMPLTEQDSTEKETPEYITSKPESIDTESPKASQPPTTPKSLVEKVTETTQYTLSTEKIKKDSSITDRQEEADAYTTHSTDVLKESPSTFADEVVTKAPLVTITDVFVSENTDLPATLFEEKVTKLPEEVEVHSKLTESPVTEYQELTTKSIHEVNHETDTTNVITDHDITDSLYTTESHDTVTMIPKQETIKEIQKQEIPTESPEQQTTTPKETSAQIDIVEQTMGEETTPQNETPELGSTEQNIITGTEPGPDAITESHEIYTVLPDIGVKEEVTTKSSEISPEKTDTTGHKETEITTISSEAQPTETSEGSQTVDLDKELTTDEEKLQSTTEAQKLFMDQEKSTTFKTEPQEAFTNAPTKEITEDKTSETESQISESSPETSHMPEHITTESTTEMLEDVLSSLATTPHEPSLELSTEKREEIEPIGSDNAGQVTTPTPELHISTEHYIDLDTIVPPIVKESEVNVDKTPETATVNDIDQQTDTPISHVTKILDTDSRITTVEGEDYASQPPQEEHGQTTEMPESQEPAKTPVNEITEQKPETDIIQSSVPTETEKSVTETVLLLTESAETATEQQPTHLLEDVTEVPIQDKTQEISTETLDKGTEAPSITSQDESITEMIPSEPFIPIQKESVTTDLPLSDKITTEAAQTIADTVLDMGSGASITPERPGENEQTQTDLPEHTAVDTKPEDDLPQEITTLIPEIMDTKIHVTSSEQSITESPVTEKEVIPSKHDETQGTTENSEDITTKDVFATMIPEISYTETPKETESPEVVYLQEHLTEHYPESPEETTAIPDIKKKEKETTDHVKTPEEQYTEHPIVVEEQMTALPEQAAPETHDTTKLPDVAGQQEITTESEEPVITENIQHTGTEAPESHVKEPEYDVSKTPFIPTGLQETETSTPQEKYEQAPEDMVTETPQELQTEKTDELTSEPQEQGHEKDPLDIFTPTEKIDEEVTTPISQQFTTKQIPEISPEISPDVTDKYEEPTTQTQQDIITKEPIVETTEIPLLPDKMQTVPQLEIDSNIKHITTEPSQETTEGQEGLISVNVDQVTEAPEQGITEDLQVGVIEEQHVIPVKDSGETDVKLDAETTTETIDLVTHKDLQDKTTSEDYEKETPSDAITVPQQLFTEEPQVTTPESVQKIDIESPQDDILKETPSPQETATKEPEGYDITSMTEDEAITKSPMLPDDESSKLPTEQTSAPKYEFPETTPYVVELEEHTHKVVEEISTIVPFDQEVTTKLSVKDEDKEAAEITTRRDELTEEQPTTHADALSTQDETKVTLSDKYPEQSTVSLPSEELPLMTTPATPEGERVGDDISPPSTAKDEIPTQPETLEPQQTPEVEIPVQTEKASTTEKSLETDTSPDTVSHEEETTSATSKATTTIVKDEISTQSPAPQDTYSKPEEKPSEILPSTATPEVPKPGLNDVQPTDDIIPDDENQFPPSGGTSGYGGPESDYVEEDQAFGPGTCRYGGKVYVSAQQIPRDDPCDFCFCFRSDIICLQQSCPPPIHGCHEEPIQGFCCPRYECPVAMATTLNITTTTTTTTTTLPPHFFAHHYKGDAQRTGCQIKGHTYKVGEVVRASSGPCLHCTCGGDGQMKCDPKACTPEPMLRQMIAAAVSAKRRR